MTLPLVSVTIPAYNQAQYLRSCLDAVWFQEYPNLEIVVVNDAASDNTVEVIEQFQHDVRTLRSSYASKYNAEEDRIERVYHPVFEPQGRSLQVITHPHNKGLAHALNTGWEASTGEYTTYIPCDDIPYPHMLKSLIAALLQNNADFAYADMFIVSDEMHVLRRFSLPEYSFSACFEDWYFCGVCKLYKRELHERCGGYDTALLAHDHALFQYFAMAGASFVHVDKALMAVRDHPEARQKGIHEPGNWNRLLEESKELVRQARDFINKQGAS